MAIEFKSNSPQFGWLSNFSSHGFRLGEHFWPTVEHYYQAQKFLDPHVRSEILQAGSAKAAKKLGRNRNLTPRPGWRRVRFEVMREAVRAKFQQNRQLRAKLIATEDEELIHQSEHDLLWGRNQAGEGLNELGKLLMEVRNELKTLPS